MYEPNVSKKITAYVAENKQKAVLEAEIQQKEIVENITDNLSAKIDKDFKILII